MITRRSFLKSASASVALSFVTNKMSFAARKPRKLKSIGLQLWTLREEMKTDFEGTIAKVAAAGYKEVEFAGYFGYTPKQVAQVLRKNGLKSPAAHVGPELLDDKKWAATLDAAHTIGHGYLVDPWIPEENRKTIDTYKRVAEFLNKRGEESKKAKIQLCYHNHFFEFLKIDGKVPYDVLLNECDPKLVKMELDLAWITVTGADPVTYFERYPGRFPLVHVKDVTTRSTEDVLKKGDFGKMVAAQTDVGKGIVDWKRIFAKADVAGIKHFFVEYEAKNPLESIKNSYEYLRKLEY